MKKMKRIVPLLLVMCLIISLSLVARADMWVPPDENYNHYLVDLPNQDGKCKALNSFLSNYVEANVSEWDTNASDQYVMDKVIKHLELNASLFPNDISAYTDADGRTCLRISEELFEKRVRILFNREIDASSHPGYQDHAIYVTAPDYGTMIRIFASANYVSYQGNEVNVVHFDIFLAPDSASNYYGISSSNISNYDLEQIGTGTAIVQFTGKPDQTDFRSTDFQLISYYMDAEGIPCTNPNAACPPPAETVPDTQPTVPTTAPAETEPPTEPATEAETEPTTTTPSAAPTQEVQPTAPRQPANGGVNFRLTTIILLVISISLAALILVLVFFKKR